MAETVVPSPVRHAWWARLLRNRAAVAGGAFVGVALLLALAGPAAYAGLAFPGQPKLRDGIYQDYGVINAGPSGVHWLGADYLGRDLLTRLFTGIRVSLTVALVVEGINIGLGGVLGLLAGYLGGAPDMLISRLADMLFAFPGLLLAILVSAVFGDTAREWFGGLGRLLLVSGALSLVSWPLMARYLRGQTLSLKERDFVLAARSLGASDGWIMARHLVPNMAWLIIVAATLDVASVIVNEATLSLLGLGIEEPGASLGLMIFKAAANLERYPLQLFVPAATITLLVLAFSFLGDGLRDALDQGG
jgi:oligopeptide transport system permease protein